MAKKNNGKKYLSVFRVVILMLLLGVPSVSLYLVVEAYFHSEKELRQTNFFLQNEQHLYTLADNIDSLTKPQFSKTGLAFRSQPQALVKHLDFLKPIVGDLDADLATKFSEIKGRQKASDKLFTQFAGEFLVARPVTLGAKVSYDGQLLNPGYYYAVFKVDQKYFRFQGEDHFSKTFIMTAEGDLMSESSTLVPSQAIREPIVQQFVQASVSRQVLMTKDRAGEDVYGFFSIVPNSNLAIFATIPVQRMFTSVFKALYLAVITMLVGLVLMLIVTKIMFSEIHDQVQKIMRLLADFSQGYFIPPNLDEVKVFKEFQPLVMMIGDTTAKVRAKITELEKDAFNEGQGNGNDV